MDGWKKLVAGALLGVAGTIYATDEEARRNLPRAARDLPDSVRRRFKSAVSAGREASSEKRREILRSLEEHGGGGGVNHRPRHAGAESDPAAPSAAEVAASEAGEPGTGEPGAADPDMVDPVAEERREARFPEPPDDATEPIDTGETAGRERRPEGA